jgi:hypothetical protein
LAPADDEIRRLFKITEPSALVGLVCVGVVSIAQDSNVAHQLMTEAVVSDVMDSEPSLGGEPSSFSPANTARFTAATADTEGFLTNDLPFC